MIAGGAAEFTLDVDQPDMAWPSAEHRRIDHPNMTAEEAARGDAMPALEVADAQLVSRPEIHFAHESEQKENNAASVTLMDRESKETGAEGVTWRDISKNGVFLRFPAPSVTCATGQNVTLFWSA